MVGSMLVGAAAGGLLLTTAALAPPAVTTRYRLETKIETVVDLSALGQGTETTNATQLAIFTVTQTDSGGGKVLHVVVDSVGSDAPLPNLAELLAKAKGAWLHGFIDGAGRTRIVATSADSNDFIAEFKARLVTFYPRIGPRAKAGTVTVDTTAIELSSSLRSVKQQIITKYTAGPEETRDGEKATRIDASFTITGAGTMENPAAGTMEVETNDGGTGTYFITSDGRYVGGNAVAEGKTLVRSAMLPEPIPVKTKMTSSVTVLK